MGVQHGLVEKSGSWYSVGSERIGQGKDNARTYLKEHPELAESIEGQLRETLIPGSKPREAQGDAEQA